MSYRTFHDDEPQEGSSYGVIRNYPPDSASSKRLSQDVDVWTRLAWINAGLRMLRESQRLQEVFNRSAELYSIVLSQASSSGNSLAARP